jgi:amino acid transporter
MLLCSFEQHSIEQHPERNSLSMSKHHARNKLTTMDAVFVTVGTMIGAGIFSVFGLTVQTAGPSAILSWVFVVLFSLPMAYTFSDLTGALVESGGPYVYLRNKLSWLGLWTAWLFLLSAVGASVGLYISLVGMLKQFGVPIPQVAGIAIAVFLGMIASRGIHIGVKVQKWLSIATILLLLFCIVLGFRHAHPPAWILHVHEPSFGWWSFFRSPAFVPHGWLGCAAATFFAFWTYSGWEAVAVPSGAYKSKKQLGYGMIIGSILVGLLYIAVAWSAILSVPTKQIAGAMNPLVFVGDLAGQWAGLIVAWGSIVVVVSSLLSWILATTSLFQSVARDGLIPTPKFTKQYRGEYHPFWTIVTLFVIIGISWLPVFTAAIAASSMTALIAYAAVFITVACDRKATWDGFIQRAVSRRLFAGFSLAMTLAMIAISGWNQLWPTLCLTAFGGFIVFSHWMVKLRKI